MRSNRRRRLRPWVGPVCGRSLGIPGGGAALAGQRLQEPALSGVPMYEAHRSWQLPGQCRAAIIMSAARNRIRHSPALLLAWAGSSLRLAVTTRFAAAFATQDAAAIPWPALPVPRYPQRLSEHMCARAASRDAGGAVGFGRSSVHGAPAGRFSAGRGAGDVSLRPAHKRNSPANTRFTKAEK